MDYSVLAGGIGLFLLGMMLMSEGLKAASGPTLARILEKGTNTRFKGFLSGFLATAILQSSTATTLLTIGFVNAGIMTFLNSLWVIFGTNVGTTMTGWLVALIGLKLKIELFALPVIGLGVLMRILGEKNKFGKIGDILSGFGLLFLGIGFLQTGFSHIGTIFDFAGMSGNGIYSLIGFLLGGFVLTIIMQSSSASIAVILTIASTTNIPLQEAAASVIGANIGTTLTAILAAIGATANAKRTASGHVIFNIITGIVALLLLPGIIGFLDIIRPFLGLDSSTSTSLALFHTIFNILGVLLMIPLAGLIAKTLEKYFNKDNEKIQVPQFLDKNLLNMPSLAVDSLKKEIERLGSANMLLVISKIENLYNKTEEKSHIHGIHKLHEMIREFIESINRESMSLSTSKKLSSLNQINDYYILSESSLDEVHINETIQGKVPTSIQSAMDQFLGKCRDILIWSNPERDGKNMINPEIEREFEEQYIQLKSLILTTESKGDINVFTMDNLMKVIHIIKGIVLRSIKAFKLLRSKK